MSFDDAGVPGQGQAGDDRVAVSVDSGREGVEAGKVVLADGVEPLREPFALALGEHLGEGPDVTGQGIRFRGRHSACALHGKRARPPAGRQVFDGQADDGALDDRQQTLAAST
ncbi:hypothetical protein ABZ901_21665 [Actinacidiphila alni]